MPDFETIALTVERGVAHLVLRRPERGNAMNLALVRELAAAARRCDQDDAVRVVRLTATGPMFSPGGDLKEFATFGERTGERTKELADHLHSAVSTLARMRALLVVAVNGLAAGAGFSLALVGDLVLAAESARFTMAYTRAGLSPDGGATYFLPRLVGLRRAQELILTNRALTAHEAHGWGIVTDVLPDDELDGASVRWAEQLASGSPAAHASAKRLLLSTSSCALEEQLEHEARSIAATAASPGGREGIEAFLAKRRPRFD